MMAPVPGGMNQMPQERNSDSDLTTPEIADGLPLQDVSDDSDTGDNANHPENDLSDGENARLASGYQLLPSRAADDAEESPQILAEHHEDTNMIVTEPSVDTNLDESLATPKSDEFAIPHQPRWDSVTLDADKVEDIKSRMANFNLPTGQHPQWASTVPETDWKSYLLQKLQSNNVI